MASPAHVVQSKSRSVVAEPERATSMLAGFRFRVVQSRQEAIRALAVRREVYVNQTGYDVPVPDAYDRRSWLLLAEENASGLVVGTMRITPSWEGSLECEESFELPLAYRVAGCVEINRFAILPGYRRGRSGTPSVFLGLFKLASDYLTRVVAPVSGGRYGLVASKPERSWTYELGGFRQTGMAAAYGSLDGSLHQLLVADFPDDWLAKVCEGPLGSFMTEAHCPEIEVPAYLPPVGIGVPAAQDRLRLAVGA